MPKTIQGLLALQSRFAQIEVQAQTRQAQGIDQLMAETVQSF
jgi:hypothetical protein